MKNLIIIISLITANLTYAQKYTDKYITDANKVASDWVNDVNSKQYDIAYKSLTKNVKERYPLATWVNLMKNLMDEFGELKERTIRKKYFESEIKGFGSGFYVFIEYESTYVNTINHVEYILLKQNDKLNWEILDYSYEFDEKKKESDSK